MPQLPQQQSRIIAITPATCGFGYAVVDAGRILVEQRFKHIKGADKNVKSLKSIEQLLAYYLPHTLVVSNHAGSHRAERIYQLTDDLIALAKRRKIKVRRYSREQVYQVFLPEGEQTKQALAETLARLFPADLGHHLPPARQAWKNEDSRLYLFEAVAMALLPHFKKVNQMAKELFSGEK